MQLQIIRIENGVVTCEIEGEGLIDIARRWFSENIQEGDREHESFSVNSY